MYLSIIFNKKYLFIWFLVALIAILAVLKVHGSSLGMYNKFFNGGDYKDKSLLFGEVRSIRSDEWVVSTPWFISQYKVNFNFLNNNIGLGQKTGIISDVPIKHWKTIFNPPSLPFFVFPLEQAFVLRWWLKGALLIISVYLLLLLFTKNNYFLSIAGSIIMFLTPFFQWWYSTGYPETSSYIFLILYFLIKIVNYKSKFKVFLSAIIILYLLICSAVMIYPPFQIPMSFLLIILAIAYFIENRNLLSKEKLKIYGICALLILVPLVVVLAFYYYSFTDIIEIMSKTSYPGKRITVGGGYTLLSFFSGFFNIKLLSDGTVPKLLGNQSEASSFFMFFPFLLPFTFYYSIKNIIEKKKTDFIILFLSFYLLISTIWIFWGLPGFLSKLLLLNLVPHNRMIIGIGIANLLLAFCFLNNFKIKISKNYITLSFILATIALLVHLYIGYYLQNFFPEFISSDFEIILISFSAFLSVLFLLFQRRKAFVLFILIYSIVSSYSVNPLYKGLDPIINSKLSKEIKEVNSKDNDKSRWVVYHDYYMGNYLVANGINSINGVHLYPQLNLWKEFDPNKKYYDVYNRYAHIFFFNNSSNSIVFNLLQPDAFNVKINPCNKVLTNLKVKYFLSPLKLKEPCLKQIKKVEYPNITYFIYEKSGL